MGAFSDESSIIQDRLERAVGAFGTAMVKAGYILPLDEDGVMLTAIEGGIAAAILAYLG